jgi:hypothetical protein
MTAGFESDFPTTPAPDDPTATDAATTDQELGPAADTPGLEELWATYTELAERIDDLADPTQGTHDHENTDPVPAALPEVGSTVYPTLADWVIDFWATHTARDLNTGLHWCSHWWDHPEAVSRLTALWERWEQLHAEPGGMALWWREADAVTAPLLAPDGTFSGCKTGERPRHTLPPPLPVTPQPVDEPQPAAAD